ncbi:Peptidyl-prolyl cis-trans isomerase pin4 [Rhodotorula toruloides]
MSSPVSPSAPSPHSNPPSSLNDRFDRLALGDASEGKGMGLGIPAFGGLGVPGAGAGGAAGAPGVRKQRSQRFTVPTSSSHPPSSSYAPPPVPSLPYLPPPPPVSTQTASSFLPPHASSSASDYTTYYSTSTSPTLPTSNSDYSLVAPPIPTNLITPEFLQSPTGMSPYPGPSFAQVQQQAQGAGLGAGMQRAWSGGSGSAVSPVGAGTGEKVFDERGEEIIETAIVIKSIPFACPREQLLAIMASLALPAPFAFNYHYAAEDPTSFRGLAFANFRTPSEASIVRAAMDGLEVMGRKLRAEFKKALKPGEKEAIERTKALKRMRSAQLLAAGANPSSFFGGGGGQGGWNRREASAPGGYGGGWGGPGGLEHDTEDYGRQIHNGAYSSHGTFGRRDFLPAPPVPPMPSYVPPPPPPELSYSGSSPPTTSADGSDVGTSVSMRMERESSEGGSDEGRKELNMNDPQTLELYSRILLFSSDSFRDELSFSRSLSPHQRRTVHLIAKKLGLEHKTLGREGEGRYVVVWKKGTAGPVEQTKKPLRQTVSTAALRRVASRDTVLSNGSLPRSATPSSVAPGSGYTPSFAMPSSQSSGSLLSPTATAAGLRGKKSMPDLRFPSSNSHGSHSRQSPTSSSSSRSPSPYSTEVPPPMPSSVSLSANLAAYANGTGYISSSASTPSLAAFGQPGLGGGITRSYSNLRVGGIESDDRFADDLTSPSSSSAYKTISSFSSSGSASAAGGSNASSSFTSPSPRKTREIPSVQSLFAPPHVNGADVSSAPSTPAREREARDLFNGGGGAGPVGGGLEWRRRV